MFFFLFYAYAESIILFGITFFFAYCFIAKTREDLDAAVFVRLLYGYLLLILSLALIALILTEGYWHSAIKAYEPQFYPFAILSSTVLSFVSKIVLLVLTMACVLLHKPLIVKNDRLPAEYCLFVLFITLASLLLISANNLAFAFIAMEMQTLALVAFALIGHVKARSVTTEAVFRYFVNASFASVTILFGLSVLYALFGTLQIDELGSLLLMENSSSLARKAFVILAVVAVFFGIFFKLTLAPFHHWVGDLYQGTSGYVGSYFTLVTKIPMWILFIKIFPVVLFPLFQPFFWTIQLIALLSVFIGSVYAFTETNFHRFWAISSIGHMGQILLGLLCLSAESTVVATFYLFLYLSANIFFWGVLLHQEARPNSELSYLEFLKTTFRFLSLSQSRLVFLTFFILLSLAGIPPAFGFAAKFYLFLTLYKAQSYFVLAVVFFCNLISLAYYLRLIRYLYFQNLPSTAPTCARPFNPFSVETYWALAFIFLIHLFLGFWLLDLLFRSMILFF
jgi:NADH-quinone oxidoreductase subunit N